jgi:hypothetical protein
MLDLIGTTVLTAVIAVNLNAAIVTMPLSATEKLTTVAIAGLWIGFAIALANTGVYVSPATPPAVGIVAATSVLTVGAIAWLSPRAALTDIPVPLVIGLNAARIAPGAFMVLLAVQGRLSGPFPQFAGWGDIIVGVLAIPVMFAAARNLSGNRGAVLAWNALGMLDLISAAALGVISAPESPLQIFGGSVGSARDCCAALVEHSDADRAVLPDHARCDLRPPCGGERALRKLNRCCVAIACEQR